jgi:hypothetical protein
MTVTASPEPGTTWALNEMPEFVDAAFALSVRCVLSVIDATVPIVAPPVV